MPIERNFLEYHKSLSQELRSTQNRIRHLIGGNHWLTDGQHKEAVLRKILRNHIAETLHVGTGFICGESLTSNQTDIMITSRNKPDLFRDGELRFVTPDAVNAIIEVKTSVQNPGEVIKKIADNISMIRNESGTQCFAGLFIYEGGGEIEVISNKYLDALVCEAHHDLTRAINWVAVGQNLFIRFWEAGSLDAWKKNSGWNSYHLKGLAHSYFLSNTIWDTCPSPSSSVSYAWFPVAGGKEQYCIESRPLGD
jgi:hypothetical protein